MPPADWRDAEQTPGIWNWALVNGRSTASFGLPGAAPLVSLSCDRTIGRVLLARAGAIAADNRAQVARDGLFAPAVARFLARLQELSAP